MQDTKESGSLAANGKTSATVAPLERTVPRESLRRRVVELLSKIWRLISNFLYYFIVLGVGVSLLASFLVQPASSATELGARLSDYLNALYQNLLVAAIVFGALALLVLLTYLARLQDDRWTKLDDKKKRQEEKEKEEQKEAKRREEEEQKEVKRREEEEIRLKRVLDAAREVPIRAEGSIAPSDDYESVEVKNLNPEICGVKRLVGPFYVKRDTDDRVREILTELALQAMGSAQKQARGDDQCLGICLFGQRNMGKSRLVYEALKSVEELADWTVVKWPLRSGPEYPFEAAKDFGMKFVVLLDGLQNAPSLPDVRALKPIQALNNLPSKLAGIPFIIVATCRDGGDRMRVENSLAPLLARLEKIELVEGISYEQADELAEKLKASGFEPQPFDNETPGSIIEGEFEDDQYKQLPDDAKIMMKMLRLFNSAGIGTATREVPVTKARACALADVLFDIPKFQWRSATDELIKRELVTHGWLEPSFERAIFVEDDSLFAIVRDYPMNGDIANMEIEDWSLLYQALRQIEDGEALLALGAALRDSQLYVRDDQALSKRDYLRRAADCYRAALEAQYEREKTVNPEKWAETQWNLAGALDAQYTYMRADDVDPSPTEILQQAEAAYRAARESLTLEDYRDAWVGLTTGLAGVLQRQAELVDGEERDALLTDAERLARDAIANASPLDEQANVDAKTSLAYVNLAQAKAATSREAVEALVREANELATSAREDTDYWLSDDQQAYAEANLQYVVRFQASLVVGSKRAELLDSIAGSLRETLSGYQATSSDRVEQKSWMQAVLAETLLQRARMVETDSATAKRDLDDTVTLCNEAEKAVDKLRIPDRSAWILGVHAGVLAQQVRWQGESDRDDLLRLLREGEGYGFKAQGIPNRGSAPEDWANTQLSNAEVQFQFARLESTGTEDEIDTARHDLKTARDFVEAALEVYRAPAFKGEYEYTMALQSEIVRQIAALSAEVEA